MYKKIKKLYLGISKEKKATISDVMKLREIVNGVSNQ